MKKRNFGLIGGGLLCIALTATTMGIASGFTTTAEQAARAVPPSPSVITAATRLGQISDTTQLACAPGFRTRALVAPAGGSGTVITSVAVSAGESVGDGTYVGEANGLPMFTLTGQFPLYRDLKLKDTGPDALLVNNALVRAGVLYAQTEPSASTVTEATAAALAYLYVQSGHAAPKRDEVLVAANRFLVVPEEGVVVGAPHLPGVLGAYPLLTLGSGGRGLNCTGTNGTLPPEARAGQSAIIPAIGTDGHEISIIDTDASALPATGAVSGAGSNADAGASSNVAPEPTVPATSKAVFIPVASGTEKLANPVSASLVLDQSPPEQLIVPSAALWTRNGVSMVSVVKSDTRTDVEVTVVFSASGESAVVPAKTDPAPLAAGDAVVVSGSAS
ncbi:hypothetical protein ACFVTM_03900 [Arthrobacter sp. NPDC058130]|uniref:hypothetical protein n=1 Tax=Arthrobacter sp. NPDC058130 TaxID=3346353 RepID=UPI0036ED3297